MTRWARDGYSDQRKATAGPGHLPQTVASASSRLSAPLFRPASPPSTGGVVPAISYVWLAAFVVEVVVQIAPQ
jgi:hypothetical protein